jgi:hypothetical protein
MSGRSGGRKTGTRPFGRVFRVRRLAAIVICTGQDCQVEHRVNPDKP